MNMLKCIPPLPGLFLFAALAATAPQPAAAESGSCTPDSRHWVFEAAEKNGGFAFVQLQRGEAAQVQDPLQPGNQVAHLVAGPKKRGKVGKADYVHRFDPLPAGTVISMQARMYFPPETPLNSVILMDLECASCGLDTNPGIRLYLRKGLLRVDRSKIGIQQPFLSTVPRLLQPGTWHEITWQVTLGKGAEGHSLVMLDGEVVSDARGTTMLTQEIVRQYAEITVQEQVDRFQVGLTANSNKQPAALFLDDVRFCLL
ncbi:heparin lyase I family protein [Leisingera sp. ANG-Vp]|uniref:heparin lyase I family protein n=1 Tax=Leisingera sp. ANG-Vp TaxID=1577896 RepID=UPI0005809019|nr:heparin lyase I family protein [Leisingera sp. ANG-Vp]KIC16248.1 hypothetical protein RA20_16825 [Leisingera sp. ANG-Vp]